jgi:hypothetical protein
LWILKGHEALYDSDEGDVDNVQISDDNAESQESDSETEVESK